MKFPAIRSRENHAAASAANSNRSANASTRSHTRRRSGSLAVTDRSSSLSASAIDPHLRAPSPKGNASAINAMPGERLPQAEAEAPGPAGHRARLRSRLLTGGAEALADYE